MKDNDLNSLEKFDIKDYPLVHNQETSRYEFHILDFKPYIEYKMVEGKYDLRHTIVPKELSGKGIASSLLKLVLADIKSQEKKIIPTCPFIKSFIEKNPEWDL